MRKARQGWEELCGQKELLGRWKGEEGERERGGEGGREKEKAFSAQVWVFEALGHQTHWSAQ